MSKPVAELLSEDIERMEWVPFIDGPSGMWVKILAEDPDTGNRTSLVKADAGVAINEIRTHDFWEETYIINGSIIENGVVYGPGSYTCYPPGHPHGPYTTPDGWLALEVVYPSPMRRDDATIDPDV